MPGFEINGGTLLTPAQLRGSTALVGVDTQFANGASPQTAAITLNTLLSLTAFNANTITAFAGGGQANGFQLGYGINRVTVVATIADSLKLPPAFPGAMVYIKNDGANSTTVYGFGTDTIDGVASATGNAQAAAKGKLYFGVSGNADGVAGTWVSLLSA